MEQLKTSFDMAVHKKLDAPLTEVDIKKDEQGVSSFALITPRYEP